MKKTTLLKLAIAFFSLVYASGCSQGPPNPGFRVVTIRLEYDFFGFPNSYLQYNIGLHGNMQSAYAGATGTVTAFVGSSGSNGRFDCVGCMAKANWTFGETSGDCAGKSHTALIEHPGYTLNLYCYDIPAPFFLVTPSAIDVNSPPASILIQGSGISSAGGMPNVEYYNLNGTLVAQDIAADVGSDGTWLSLSTPDISTLPSGRYLLTVRNADGVVAGSGWVDVFNYSEPPPDPGPGDDGGGCQPDMVCYAY